MRESITTIRKLLRGEQVPLGGGVLEGIKRSQASAPPVSVAVAGPRMTELAGEIGDEVMTVTGHDKKVIDAVRLLLENGAARSGRSLDEFQVSDWAWVRVDDDEQAAFDYLKSTLSDYLGSAQVTLDALGLEWPLDRPDDIPESEWRQYLEAVAFFGPAEKIADQFQDLANSGHLDRIVCGISGPDDEMALAAFGRAVLPRVK
jgi:alkanesulfonate monooxygenase SsuD/methylene tetrahydromethanopterin reductase-like flavin-dependent oxidoreductase (luciferase family)